MTVREIKSSEKEKIVCAAFRFIFSACEEVVLTINYEMNNHAKYLYGLDYLTGFDKGFITNKNRFVDAKEAMSIALKACQIQAVENIAMRAAHHRQLGNTSILATERSALEALVESLLARPLKPEDLY